MDLVRLRSAISPGYSLALVFLVTLGLDAFAQSSEDSDGAELLVGRAVVTLPSFSEISERPLIELYTNESEYERARSDAGYRLERLTYISDGIEVVAYLYRPNSVGTPQQTIVFNRGSYIRNDAAPEYLAMFHRLAKAGFVVLSPMYRGSEGAGGKDEMGGDDLNDLMRTAELADELPSVDARRLFLLGESRGGMMVLQAIRDGYPARAAATYGSPTDFFRLLADDPERYEGIADQIWPEWRSRTDEIIGRRSAVNWADRIDVPLLILHGGEDRSMPVGQSLRLAATLQALGKSYELHVFGYQNHMISGMAVERDALATAWFERHVSD